MAGGGALARSRRSPPRAPPVTVRRSVGGRFGEEIDLSHAPGWADYQMGKVGLRANEVSLELEAREKL